MTRRTALPAAIVFAASLLLPGGPAAAESRNRALERALDGSVAAADAEQVERAFRAAGQAGVRERHAEELVEALAEAGSDGPQLARVLSLAAQLALEGLPLKAFAEKVLEGVAKRAPPERVVAVAERRAPTLTRAQGIVKTAILEGAEGGDPDELVAGLAGARDWALPIACRSCASSRWATTSSSRAWTRSTSGIQPTRSWRRSSACSVATASTASWSTCRAAIPTGDATSCASRRTDPSASSRGGTAGRRSSRQSDNPHVLRQDDTRYFPTFEEIDPERLYV